MTKTRQFKIWDGMKQRCLNPKCDVYDKYGGRGITICDRWMKFENFWDDMKEGYSPNLTLDRKNNDAGYCKENCRWATPIQQSNNKRNNRFLKFEGKEMTLANWARAKGMRIVTLKNRLHLGWSVERALTAPVREMTYC